MIARPKIGRNGRKTAEIRAFLKSGASHPLARPGADYGVVAVPGSDIVHGLADPVAVIASSGSLGLMIPEKEVLLVLDRGDTWYEERQFFAYADGAGNVSIRRMDGGYGEDAPDGYTIAGRVGVINLPYDAATMASSGTWLEDGDADM